MPGAVGGIIFSTAPHSGCQRKTCESEPNNGTAFIDHVIHSCFGRIRNDCANCSQNPGYGPRLTGRFDASKKSMTHQPGSVHWVNALSLPAGTGLSTISSRVKRRGTFQFNFYAVCTGKSYYSTRSILFGNQAPVSIHFPIHLARLTVRLAEASNDGVESLGVKAKPPDQCSAPL
jgi:hypothetical protein